MYRYYLSYLDKYLGNKKIKTAKELNEIFKDANNHAIAAAKNFINYLVKKGVLTKSQAIDLASGLKLKKTRERTEIEKYLPKTAIFIGFKNIIGEDETLMARKLFFKLCLFTGLREAEVRELINQFDFKVLENTYKAYDLEELKDKIAVYDMEEVKIKTRAEETKRSYVALFPKELLAEIEEFKKTGYKISQKTYDPSRMFSKEFLARDDLNLRDKNGKFIFLTKVRKYTYNLMLNIARGVANKDKEIVADLDEIIEFMQGRAPKTVGGRHYRENFRTAAKLYYLLVDEFKETFKEILKG